MRFNLTPEEIESLINPDKNGKSDFFYSLSNGIGQKEYEEKHLSATIYELDKERESLVAQKVSLSEDIKDNWENAFPPRANEGFYSKTDEVNAKLRNLDVVRGSAYFGRMDVEDDEGGYNSYYIGKKGVEYLEIVDWRTPMGIKYYQQTDREFTIKVNDNTRDYSVRLRRRLEVKGDVLTSMQDEFISSHIPSCTPEKKPEEPSKPIKTGEMPQTPAPAAEKKESAVFDPYLLEIVRSRKEKNEATDIIESIQEKQIEIISLPESSEFVVQGVAGSGKTMILLHRLSRLLFTNRVIRPSRVIVITPSDSFSGFIGSLSEILELDRIKTSTLFEYYVDLLESADIDIAKKMDRVTPVPEKYLEYIFSEKFSSDVERAVRGAYYSLYGILTAGDKSPAQTIWEVSRKLKDEYSQTERANDRIRMSVLGELRGDTDGKKVYSKTMGELWNDVNAIEEFLRLFSTDDDMQKPSGFLIGFCSFAKALKHICKNFVVICNRAADDLDDLSVEVRSEIESVPRSDVKRIKTLEDLLDGADKEEKKLSSMKEQFSLIFDASAEMRGNEDFVALSQCSGIKDIAMLIYDGLVPAKKKEHGIRPNRYNNSDAYVLCLIFSKLEYRLTPDYLYFFIDEGQDVSVSEYRLLRFFNPNARFNVYGDLRQNMTPWRGVRDWNEIGLELYSIYANYRNTNEIINYVSDNLGVKMTSIGLGGGDVRRIDMSETESFLSGKKGLRAIICSQERVQKLRSEKYNVIAETGSVSNSVINLMSAYESKGLEFTAVVVVDNDLSANEKYIAYTRALRDLAVTEYKEPDTASESEDVQETDK